MLKFSLIVSFCARQFLWLCQPNGSAPTHLLISAADVVVRLLPAASLLLSLFSSSTKKVKLVDKTRSTDHQHTAHLKSDHTERESLGLARGCSTLNAELLVKGGEKGAVTDLVELQRLVAHQAFIK